MSKVKQPTITELARVVGILETYGDGTEAGVFRESDVKACRAVAKSLTSADVKREQKRLRAESIARFNAKLKAMGGGRG